MTDEINSIPIDFANAVHEKINDALVKGEAAGFGQAAMCEMLSMILIEKSTALLCGSNIAQNKNSDVDVEKKINRAVRNLLKSYKESGLYKERESIGAKTFKNVKCEKCGGPMNGILNGSKYDIFCPRCK